MKRYIDLLAIIFLLICSQSCHRYKREAERLMIERDTLQARYSYQTEQFAALKAYIDDISSTLDSIAIRENMLFLPDPETPHIPLTKRQIQKRLDDFQALIIRQHEKITALEDSLYGSQANLKNVRTLVTYFKLQIQEKDAEIAQMKAELNSKNANIRQLKSEVSDLKSDVASLHAGIDTLQTLTDMQNKLIAEQSAQLSEAYYIVGTRKELVAKGIIRNTKVASSLDLSLFNTVDKRTFTSLDLPSAKVRILTQIPDDSYEVVRHSDGGAALKIKEAERFWALGNILVIQVR